MSNDPTPDLELLGELLGRARATGADSADAILVRRAAIGHTQRLGEIEKLEREESQDLGLRVFVGKQQAIVSSNDLGADARVELVQRALAMARTVPEDPYCGLAQEGEICNDPPKLDIADHSEPSPETLIERAAACEDAARAIPGITNSEGADASWSLSQISLAASNGFADSYACSSHSVSAAVVAGEGTGMESDYDYATAVYGEDLEAPEEVGRRAGEKTVKRLGPRKVKTQQVPVVYDPRVAGGMLRHLIGAIRGTAVARGSSFLKDRLGEQIFSKGVVIIDDPHRPRGHKSKPFDGEGIANQRRELVADGVLTTWIMDLTSARQLGLPSTGHAARSTTGPPIPAATNLYMQPGTLARDELMADISQGFFVTELMGMGINQVTGDYSRGASGYWIENGIITYPVAELTVAGNLQDMFLNITPANDIEFRTGTDAPTLRIDGMTVAGTAGD